MQEVDPTFHLEPAEVDHVQGDYDYSHHVQGDYEYGRHGHHVHLTPEPPSWPDQSWQAPEPQPVNTGLSGGDSSSRNLAAELENALLGATIAVTIFFALVLVVILAKLYQTFDSPLPADSTVESQLSYLTSSGTGCQEEHLSLTRTTFDKTRTTSGKTMCTLDNSTTTFDKTRSTLDSSRTTRLPEGDGRVSALVEEEQTLPEMAAEDEDVGDSKY